MANSETPLLWLCVCVTMGCSLKTQRASYKPGAANVSFDVSPLAATTTTTRHPFAPGPHEYATKILHCNNLRVKAMCLGPHSRKLGHLVESVALCKTLCEAAGKSKYSCCTLTRDASKNFVCHEYQPPYVSVTGGDLDYAATCRWEITANIPFTSGKNYLSSTTTTDLSLKKIAEEKKSLKRKRTKIKKSTKKKKARRRGAKRRDAKKYIKKHVVKKQSKNSELDFATQVLNHSMF